MEDITPNEGQQLPDPDNEPFIPNTIEEIGVSLPSDSEDTEQTTICELIDLGLIPADYLAFSHPEVFGIALVELIHRYKLIAADTEMLRAHQRKHVERIVELTERNEEQAAIIGHLEEALMTDTLTKIGSRWALDMRQNQLLAQLTGQERRKVEENDIVERRRGSEEDIVAVVVMSVDIIGLGDTNNTVSQQEGDKLLVQVAQSIKAMSDQFREGDVFRRGGDEFIGLFPVRNEQDFTAIYDKMSTFVNSEAGKRLRLGYFVSYAQGRHNLVEAEKLADPKVHPENRLVVLERTDTN